MDPLDGLCRQRLVELVERIPILDSRVRRHEPGGVHKMRVTLRRLRSLLATFAPLFDAATVESLRADLRWVAGELGGARDSEVLRKRMQTLATTPEEHALVDRIGHDLVDAESDGVDHSVAALDSERYSEMLRTLTTLTSELPSDSEADDSSDDLLRRRVRREWKRLRRRVSRARDVPAGAERDMALHEVRKAAKRLRYSAEVLVPAYGEEARRLTRGAKRIQTHLGEVQDSAVSQQLLTATAEGAEVHEAFVLGGLHARERRLSTEAQARYARTWAKLARKKNRRWLA